MRSSESELLACVGRNGSFYPFPRENAHKLALDHLVVRVLAFDENGEYLVQKRSLSRPTYPGAYTDSASGHVLFDLGLLSKPGAILRTEAMRELEEEVGVSVISKNHRLIRAFDNPTYSAAAHEVNYCFVALVDDDLVPSDEVNPCATGFYDSHRLREMLSSEKFVPEAKTYWKKLLDFTGKRNPCLALFGIKSC